VSITGTATNVASPRRDDVARRSWDGVLGWSGSIRPIAVMRIALGAITLLHLRPFLRDAIDGVAYDDHFWEPFVPWLPHLPGRVWFALLWVGAAAAVLMAIGLCTRPATVTALAVVATNLLLSQTHFRHNRTFLVILLLGLALLPAGRELSVDAWLRRRRGHRGARGTRGARGAPPPAPALAALWPVWLLRVQVCLVYFASGFSKLIDADWFGGLVLWDRVVRYRHVLEPTPLPGWAVDLLTERWPYHVIAPAAVATELFIAIGLWFARSRLAAVWVALVFHVLIEISASVEVFSYAAIAALAIWVTPVTRDRVVRIGGDSDATALAVGALLRAGDWFARFDVVRGRVDDPVLTLVERDGSVHTGGAAARRVLARLPLTFPLAAPVGWVAARRRRDPLAAAAT
jgi:hypothetical protein